MAKGKDLAVLPNVTTGQITHAIAGGRKAVEAFVNGLKKDELLPFLVKATPVKKDFDYGVKLAEQRVATEEVLKRGQEWADPETAVLHVWDGALGEVEMGDPAGCYAELSMLDVPVADLDATFYKVWKVDFNNVKRIESMGVRLSKSGDKAEQERGKRIVETVKNYRSRKADGPPHLKEKE